MHHPVDSHDDSGSLSLKSRHVVVVTVVAAAVILNMLLISKAVNDSQLPPAQLSTIRKAVKLGSFGTLAIIAITGFMVLRPVDRRIQKQIDELTDRREKLGHLLHSLPEGVMLVDDDGQIVFANRRAEDMLGFGQTGLDQQNFEKLLPRESPLRGTTWQIGTDVDPDRQIPDRSDVNLIRSDGKERPFELLRSRVDWFGENITVAIVRDARDKQRADETMQMLMQAIQSTNQGVVITNPRKPNMPIIFANEAFLKLSGRTQDEVIGTDGTAIVQPEQNTESFDRVRQAYEESGSFEGEAQLTRKDGRIYWAYLHIAPVRAGDRVLYYVATIEDYTQRREAQQALEANNAELEERVVARTRQVEESRRFLQSVLDALPNDVAVLDEKCRLNYVNRGWERLLTYTNDLDESQIGYGYFDILKAAGITNKESDMRLRLAVENALSTRRENFWQRLHERDGDRWFEISGNGFSIDDKGFAVVSHSDVTERQRDEERLQRARELVENGFGVSPQPIIIADAPDGKITYINDAGIRVCGNADGAVVGMNIRDYLGHWKSFYPDGRPYERTDLPLPRAIERGEISRDVEILERDQAGTERWILANAAPIRNKAGEVIAGIVIFPEITNLKTAQIELEKARQQADAANQAKSAFVANMSHEIRTPLNAVLGYAQMLGRDKNLAPQQAEQVDIINRSGHHLLDLINDILEISKIEADRVEIHHESFDLHAMLQDLGLMFEIRTKDRGIEMQVDIGEDVPRMVTGDPAKLRQILINLTGNSVKFTETGYVRLSAALVKKEPDPEPGSRHITFRVTDTGLGMEAEDLKKIFEAFEQTKEGTEEGGGTGLGLAISRKLVGILGGAIKVSSVPGEGSEFTFSIPLHIATEAGAEEEGMGHTVFMRKTDRKTKILVAEDEEQNRELLQRILEREDYEVILAENGLEAVEKFEAAHPNIVLMDNGMPEMTGLDAIEKLNESEAGRRTPFILISADVFEDVRERARKVGVAAYLAKPYTTRDLLKAISKEIDKLAEAGRSANTAQMDRGEFLDNARSQAGRLEEEQAGLLMAAAESADYDRLMVLLDSMHDSRGEFVAYLRELVERFDYETLIQFVNDKGDNGNTDE